MHRVIIRDMLTAIQIRDQLIDFGATEIDFELPYDSLWMYVSFAWPGDLPASLRRRLGL